MGITNEGSRAVFVKVRTGNTLRELKGGVAGSMREIKRLNQQLGERNYEVNRLRDLNSDLQTELQQFVVLNEDLARCNKRLQEEVQGLKTQLAETKSALANQDGDLEQEVFDLRSEKEELDGELKHLHQVIAAKNTHISALMTSGKRQDKEIAGLKFSASIDAEKTANPVQCKHCTGLAQENQELKSHLNRVTRQVAGMAQANLQQVETIQALNKIIDLLRSVSP